MFARTCQHQLCDIALCECVCVCVYVAQKNRGIAKPTIVHETRTEISEIRIRNIELGTKHVPVSQLML